MHGGRSAASLAGRATTSAAPTGVSREQESRKTSMAGQGRPSTLHVPQTRAEAEADALDSSVNHPLFWLPACLAIAVVLWLPRTVHPQERLRPRMC